MMMLDELVQVEEVLRNAGNALGLSETIADISDNDLELQLHKSQAECTKLKTFFQNVQHVNEELQEAVQLLLQSKAEQEEYISTLKLKNEQLLQSKAEQEEYISTLKLKNEQLLQSKAEQEEFIVRLSQENKQMKEELRKTAKNSDNVLSGIATEKLREDILRLSQENGRLKSELIKSVEPELKLDSHEIETDKSNSFIEDRNSKDQIRDIIRELIHEESIQLNHPVNSTSELIHEESIHVVHPTSSKFIHEEYIPVKHPVSSKLIHEESIPVKHPVSSTRSLKTPGRVHFQTDPSNRESDDSISNTDTLIFRLRSQLKDRQQNLLLSGAKIHSTNKSFNSPSAIKRLDFATPVHRVNTRSRHKLDSHLSRFMNAN